jgi:hypothetical protein
MDTFLSTESLKPISSILSFPAGNVNSFFHPVKSLLLTFCAQGKQSFLFTNFLHYGINNKVVYIIHIFSIKEIIMEKIRIQDDLYTYVNQAKLDELVIPDDMPVAGGFAALGQDVEKLMIGEFNAMCKDASYPNEYLERACTLFTLAPDEKHTLVMLAFTLTAFMNLVFLCRPFNRIRAACVALSAICIAGGIFFGGNWFGLTAFTLPVVLLTLAFVLLSVPLHAGLSALYRLTVKAVGNRKKKTI